MSNTPAHTGLEARLKQLNPAQALTVGDALELIKVVNHNAYRLEALAREGVPPKVCPARHDDLVDSLPVDILNPASMVSLKQEEIIFQGLPTFIFTAQ